MAKKKKRSEKKETPAQRPKRGNRGGFLKIIFIALIILVAGIVLLSMYGERIFHGVKGLSAPQKTAQREVLVFFGDEEGENLKAEKRSIKSASIEDEIRQTLSMLIKGPEGKALTPTMPEGASLMGISLKGASLSADFSKELKEKHPGGSTGEILTVYSIVDTIAVNFPSIKEVQILIEGKITETLAGHIDISVPIEPRVKRQKSEV